VNPAADNTYDLGSASYRWKDVHVGPGSVSIWNTTGTNYELGDIGFSSNVFKISTSQGGAGTVRPIQIATGANTGIYQDAAGKVGIGTAAPADQLEVVGNIKLPSLGSLIRLGSVTSSYNRRAYITSTGDATYYRGLCIAWGNPSDSPAAQAGPTLEFYDPNPTMYFYTNRGDKQAIFSLGNYTNNDNQRLILKGGTTSYPSATATNLIDSQASALHISSTDHLSLLGSNVGINNESPQSTLDVAGKTRTRQFSLQAKTELTIASGAVTVTRGFHTIDTEGDAASDDLDTINGGEDGAVLVIRPVHTDRTVVVKHNTGNIVLQSGADITLDDSTDKCTLIYDADLAKWIDL
jgi:hypothetical protein